jgi:hypothetical protein
MTTVPNFTTHQKVRNLEAISIVTLMAILGEHLITITSPKIIVSHKLQKLPYLRCHFLLLMVSTLEFG